MKSPWKHHFFRTWQDLGRRTRGFLPAPENVEIQRLTIDFLWNYFTYPLIIKDGQGKIIVNVAFKENNIYLNGKCQLVQLSVLNIVKVCQCNFPGLFPWTLGLTGSAGLASRSWRLRVHSIHSVSLMWVVFDFEQETNKKTNLEAVPTGALLKTIGHIQLTFQGYGTKPTWSAQPPGLSERRLRHRRKIAAGSASETATPTLELMLLPLQAATIGKMSGIIGTSWLIGPPFLYSHTQSPREFPSLIPWILCDLTSLRPSPAIVIDSARKWMEH